MAVKYKWAKVSYFRNLKIFNFLFKIIIIVAG